MRTLLIAATCLCLFSLAPDDLFAAQQPEDAPSQSSSDAQDADDRAEGRDEQDQADRRETTPRSGRQPEGLLQRLGIRLNNDRRGVLFDRVDREGVFGRAGLRPGDTVLDVNGNRISSAAELLQWMQTANLDRPMQVTVERDGEPRSFKVDVPRFRRFFEDLADEFEAEGDRPQRFEANRPDYDERWDEPPAGRRPALGVTLDARYRRSAIVARVLPDSGAAEAGLRPGDRILSVNGRALDSADQLAQMISELGAGDTVELQFERPVRRQARVRLSAGSAEPSTRPPAADVDR